MQTAWNGSEDKYQSGYNQEDGSDTPVSRRVCIILVQICGWGVEYQKGTKSVIRDLSITRSMIEKDMLRTKRNRPASPTSATRFLNTKYAVNIVTE